MPVIETTFAYTRKNLMEFHTELYRKNRKRFQLMALVGLAMILAGITMVCIGLSNITAETTPDQSNGAVPVLFLGVFWTVFFLVNANGAARKATKSVLKSNQKYYETEVVTRIRFYGTSFIAKNEASGQEKNVQMNEVTRVIRTENLIALVLPDRVTVIADRRSIDGETDAELWTRLCEKCEEAKFDDAT